MILLVSIGVAIVLLAILIYAIPLRVSIKGKSIILAASVFIGAIGIMSIQVLSIWQVILYPLLLSILFSYFLTKKIELTQEPEFESTVENISPIFSFAEQVEKAKLAETIDDYYDPVENSTIDTINEVAASIEIPSVETINEEVLEVEIPEVTKYRNTK